MVCAAGKLRVLFAAVCLSLVAACGGGGGDEQGGAAVPPAITTQPQAVLVTAGQPAVFTVMATGTAPLSYQWRRNGTPVAGATAAAYTTPATVIGDSGAQFSVVVSNSAGSTTSASAVLTVNAAGTYSITATVSGLSGGSLTLQNNGANDVTVTSNGPVTIATGVATGTAYNITLVSSPAPLSCVVGNASGVVAAASVSNITVACSAAPPAETGARYIEVWSSADRAANGYQLAVVDPAIPGTLIPVDVVPYTGAAVDTLVHIHGGTWNATSGALDDPGVRHVVYSKNGSLYRVSLDKGGPVPAPVRLSTETLALASGLFVAAQNRDGSDAVIGYRIPVGASFAIRFVGLLATPASSPHVSPTFAGDLIYGTSLGYSLDAAGQISSLLWQGLRPGGGGRLYRTDPDFTDAASIATFADLPAPAWLDGEGRMARGLFFYADGALQRYDDATGSVRVVFPGVTQPQGALFDDTHVYAHVNTAAGRRLVRAPDAADSTGVVIASDGFLNDAGLVLSQTRDYIIVRNSGTATAVSVRKTDGLQTTLTNAGGLLFSWQSVGIGVRNGYTSGNRVYYYYLDPTTAQNRLGSVLPDNSDRKEMNGLTSDITALPAAVMPHRFAGANELFSQPVGRFLLRDGNQLRSVDAATGDAVATVGNWPASLGVVTINPPYYNYAGMGRVGAIGHVRSSGGVSRADAWLVSDQAGSLRRLTSNIP